MQLPDDELADEDFSSRIAAFDDALISGNPQREPSDREAELDPQLRSRLERSQSCLRLLNQLWPRSDKSQERLGWRADLPDSGDAPPPDAPVQIGRFRVVREIGRGGFGVVFLAVDQLLSREVALKIPRPEVLLTPQLRERFLREAVAAAALCHHNLLPVYEAGQVGPICYIASAYCRGRNLADWLAEQVGSVPFRTAADLVAKLADGVEHAHASGVLHRDIKPSNILLEPAGATANRSLRGEVELHPKLTDFGLAKLFDCETAADATPMSAVIGTPGYMAPEQAAHNVAEIGPAADVYSLGVILYEMLTGQLPAGGKSGRPTLQQVLSEEPILPRKLRSQTPRDLEAICLKCLEKEPRRRYGTASALAVDLRRFLQGQSTAARPLGAGRRGWRWVRRRPSSAALIALSAVVLLGIPLGRGWYLSRLSRAVVSAEQKSSKAERLRTAAEQREEQMRRRYYAAGVKLAGESLKQSRVGEASELLSAQRPLPGQPDLRGFAWRYLWRLSHGDPTILTTENEKAEAVYLSFSHDGQRLAAAGRNGLVKLWDMNTRKLATTLRGHDGPVDAVAFAPDGRTIVSSSADGTVRLWNAETGEQKKILLRSAPEVLCLAFSRDGAMLAVGGRDFVLRLWDTATWTVHKELTGHTAEVRSLDFSPDGKQLASGGADGMVMLWRLDVDSAPVALHGHEDTVSCVVFSHDGALVASASDDHSVKLWDPATGQLKSNLPGHTTGVNFAEFSFDGRWLVTVSKAGMMRLWNAKTGTLERIVHGHDRAAWCATFSPRDNILATSGADRQVKLWDLTRLDNQQALPDTAAPVGFLAISPNSKLLAAGDVAGGLYLYDLPAGTLRFTSHEHTDQVNCLMFSPTGQQLASSSLDGAVRLWNARTGRVDKTLDAHAGGAYSVAFSVSGQRLATGSGDGTITLWNAETGKKQFDLRRHTGPVTSLVFAAEGRSLVSGSHDGTVKLWDLTNRGEPISLPGVEGEIESLDITPNSEMLAAGGKSRTVYVWDLRSRTLLSSRETHAARILSVSFGPRGRTLVSADAAGVVKLWNTIALDELVTFNWHQHEVAATAFSSNGMMLATGGRSSSDRGEILLWLADADDDE